MAKVVACAVTRDAPPHLFVAEDQDTLNWVLALKLVAATPSSELDPVYRDELRRALRQEQWGAAVRMWIEFTSTEIDVYPSFVLHTGDDVEMASSEMEFSPLFRDA